MGYEGVKVTKVTKVNKGLEVNPDAEGPKVQKVRKEIRALQVMLDRMDFMV